MDDHVPLYAQPTGPLNDDVLVARSFVRRVYAGHSPRFHVEGEALMVDRLDTAALRIGPATILVRLDLPDAMATARPLIEGVLEGEGYACLDEDNLLAAAVAIQATGLRISKWDLWGTDLDEAYSRLRAGAVGDEWNPVLTQTFPDDSPL